VLAPSGSLGGGASGLASLGGGDGDLGLERGYRNDAVLKCHGAASEVHPPPAALLPGLSTTARRSSAARSLGSIDAG